MKEMIELYLAGRIFIPFEFSYGVTRLLTKAKWLYVNYTPKSMLHLSWGTMGPLHKINDEELSQYQQNSCTVDFIT